MWPWRSRLGRPLHNVGSWQRAHRLVAALRRSPRSLGRVPLPAADGLVIQSQGIALLREAGSGGPAPRAQAEEAPGGPPGPAGSPTVTCSAHSPSFIAVGCVDGTVRVTDLRPAPEGGSGVTAIFPLGSGSVRHMQLVTRRSMPPAAPAPPELFAGSWNGTIHALDLRSGAARLVVRDLGGPVLALCVVGDAIAASAGDGRIGVFDVSGRSGERWVGAAQA